MLDYRPEPPIAWLKLSRPEKLNALTRGFWDDLRQTLAVIADDDAIRVVILHGEGKAFCAGADIEGFGELAGSADRRAFMRECLTSLQVLETFPKPTIAAVHGYVTGGGVELAMMTDIVVADETATFALPEAAVGVVPGLALVRGLDYLNLHWLKYMMFTGDKMDAARAQHIGLVNDVVVAGGHLAAAEALARRIATRAPLALAVGKAVIQRHADEGYGHAIEALALLQGSDDLTEGVAAFKARREPLFSGR
jgi:enoyl-CoA hydratase